MSTGIRAALCVLLWAAPAGAETTAMTYLCDRGVSVPVVYVPDADPAVAVLYIEGRLIHLQAMPSGSGARYGWPSDGSSYEWWEHQGRARLGWHEGASDAMTPIYTDCVPQD
jgi:membrane-bound inhibitor of C-type lysozyme